MKIWRNKVKTVRNYFCEINTVFTGTVALRSVNKKKSPKSYSSAATAAVINRDVFSVRLPNEARIKIYNLFRFSFLFTIYT